MAVSTRKKSRIERTAGHPVSARSAHCAPRLAAALCLALLFGACGPQPERPAPLPDDEAAPDQAQPGPDDTPVPAPPAGDGATNWTVTGTGAGPVTFGMSGDEARKALGQVKVAGSDEESCFYLAPEGDAPDGLFFMVADGRVVRADVRRGSRTVTTLGVRTGDSEEEAKIRLGPEVEVSQHAYIDDGHYLSAPTGEGDTLWVVSTDAGRVTDLQVGFEPQVGWIEGCS